MFTTLINWFSSLWGIIKGIWQACWDFVRSIWAFLLATVVGFIAITESVVSFVSDRITDLVAAFSGLTTTGLDPSSHVGTATIYFDRINTFVPLGEGFTLLTAYGVMLLLASLYRFIKSLIPTLA